MERDERQTRLFQEKINGPTMANLRFRSLRDPQSAMVDAIISGQLHADLCEARPNKTF